MSKTTPWKSLRTFAALTASVAALSLAGISIAPSATAATNDGRVSLGSFTPLSRAAYAPKHLQVACSLPSSRDISGFGDYARYTEFPSVTYRQDVGQDTFFSYRPTRIGNDLNWYISPYLGGAYNARIQVVVKYVENNTCKTGTALVQYGTTVSGVRGIDPSAKLTRAVFTKRPNWQYLVGVEISVPPLATTAPFAAEWQKAGGRTMLYPVGSTFVTHARPTLSSVAGGTYVVSEPSAHRKVRIQVRYLDAFGRVHTTARTGYGLCGIGKTRYLAGVSANRITATLVEGVTC